MAYWILLIFICNWRCVSSQRPKCERYVSGERVLGKLTFTADNAPLSASSISVCGTDVTELQVNELSSVASMRSILPDTFSSLSRLQKVEIMLSHVHYSKPHVWRNSSADLTDISLAGCHIESLPTFNAFVGADNLVSLNLSDNRLTALPLDLFFSSSKIRYLDLSRNRFTYPPHIDDGYNLLDVNVTGNPIACNCWATQQRLRLNFSGIPTECLTSISGCNVSLQPDVYSAVSGPNLEVAADNASFFAGSEFELYCSFSAPSSSIRFAWWSPIGFIPGPDWYSSQKNSSEVTFSYTYQPLVATTKLVIKHDRWSSSTLRLIYLRGHHEGDWLCLVRDEFGVKVSHPVRITVRSGLYSVYHTSLIVGFTAMLSVLAVGILVGMIRYLKETNCFRKLQPHSGYQGETFIGVIPVPECSDPAKWIPRTKLSPVEEDYVPDPTCQPLLCGNCMGQPQYFCSRCQHDHLLDVAELEIVEDDAASVASDTSVQKVQPSGDRTMKEDVQDSRPLLRQKRTSYELSDLRPSAPSSSQPLSPEFSPESALQNYSVAVVQNAEYLFPERQCFCQHVYQSSLSPGLGQSRDVKLLVPDFKMAEEYTQALNDIQEAAAANDMVGFRDRLEAFRTRIRKDTTQGVRVARDEWVALWAKSARSVASIRNQSTTAAQRMRAGITHGYEQVKDGMRSMAELCGAPGSVGQAISVVSVYTDGVDNLKKEKRVSAFYF